MSRSRLWLALHETWHRWGSILASILGLGRSFVKVAAVRLSWLLLLHAEPLAPHNEGVELARLLLGLLLLLLLLRHLAELIEVDCNVHASEHVGLVTRHPHHVLGWLLVRVLSGHGSLLHAERRTVGFTRGPSETLEGTHGLLLWHSHEWLLGLLVLVVVLG